MAGRSRVLLGLLLVVSAAAAVLSFTALHELAVLCGFGARTAPLLPVVIDAGAAAATLAWLAGAPRGRAYARALALALLGLSVAGNALGHALSAFGGAPAWWVVVIVSSVPPAVLGAVVHLVLVTGPARENAGEGEGGGRPAEPSGPGAGDGRVTSLIESGAGRRRLARALDITEHEARQLIAQRRPAA